MYYLPDDDDEDDYFPLIQYDQLVDYRPKELTTLTGKRGTTAQSMFQTRLPVTMMVVDHEGVKHTIRSSDVVTSETIQHVNDTGAVCQEWFVGYMDLSTGGFGEYRDNGASWVLDEFFMTNWWEGYVWNNDTGVPTGRNPSFVPSNTSTYPFLCGLPYSVWPSTIGKAIQTAIDSGDIDDYDADYEARELLSAAGMAQWVAMSINGDQGLFDDDDFVVGNV